MCNVLNRINCIKIKACAFISELRYSRGGVIVNAEERDSTRMAISLRCTPLRCTPREKKDRRAILFELENTALRYPCPFFQDYMLGYGDHFDREHVYATAVVKGAS